MQQHRAALLRSALCLTTGVSCCIHSFPTSASVSNAGYHPRCRSRALAKPRPSPTLFFFPGLDSRPWHDTAQFPWVQTLEAHRDVIRDEFLALRDLRQKAAADAGAGAGAEASASDYNVNDKEHQLHEGQWDWLSYVTQGRRQADFALHCPKTVEVLESVPGFMAGLPFAYSFFSVLKPKVSERSSGPSIRRWSYNNVLYRERSRASRRIRRRAISGCAATSRYSCPTAAASAWATRCASGRKARHSSWTVS
jgi:hypothetical protein